MTRWSSPGIIPLALLLLFLFCSMATSVSGALNGTETILSSDTADTAEFSPAISGNWVAWVRNLDTIGSQYVFVYNLETGEEFTSDPILEYYYEISPAIDGNTLVWFNDPDGVTFEVIAFNLLTKTEIGRFSVTPDPAFYPADPLKYDVFPKISGTTVVWRDYSSTTSWDIFSYNLSTSGPVIPIIADASYDEKNPAVSGNFIAYENWSSGQSDIYLYFISNQTAARISSDIGNDEYPSLSQNIIAWQGINGAHTYIYYYNIQTGQISQLTPAGADFDQTHPAVSGTKIAVMDYREDGAYADIYLYNTADGSERWLTPGSRGSKLYPAMYSDRVVWEDGRAGNACGGCSGDRDIYLMTVGTPVTCPVADFTAIPDSGGNPLSVVFTDASQPVAAVSHRVWNFSDGSAHLTDPLPVTHLFSQNGIFPVKLTVSNPNCRNVSVLSCSHNISVNSPPVAAFSATPVNGFVPLTIAFTDLSCGTPKTWNWSFGDGVWFNTTNTALRNPTHVYQSSAQQFNVKLKVNNTYGENEILKNNFIRTFMGSQRTSSFPVTGITVDNRFGGSFLTYNGAALPSFRFLAAVPSSSLQSFPPEQYGWKNITFTAADAIGFADPGANQTWMGNVSRFFILTNDTISYATGTPPAIGSGWGVNYQLNTTIYPASGIVKTEIWEGATDSDRQTFEQIAAFQSGVLLRDIAYTAKIIRTNMGAQGDTRINMSVATDWVEGSGPSVSAGRANTSIMGYGYDGSGNKKGTVLPTNYRFTSGTLDYFEADIPGPLTYLDTFALAKLSGSGNPFQIISLSVSSHMNPENNPSNPDIPGSNSQSDDSGSSKAGTGQHAPSQQNQPEAPAPPSPGSAKSADLYSNEQGVVTQATVLQSVDQLATVSIGQGVKALDATGNPLPSVSIDKISSGQLPGISPPGSLSFAGLAYELQPNGATFSPAITVAFSVPNAQWGKEYSIREFDHSSQTWVDLSTIYHTDSGTISASVSHFCCIALFSNAITPVPNAHPTVQEINTAPITAPPPSSAMAIFYGMMLWVAEVCMKNIYLVLILSLLAFAIYLKGRKKRLDRIRYKL